MKVHTSLCQIDLIGEIITESNARNIILKCTNLLTNKIKDVGQFQWPYL